MDENDFQIDDNATRNEENRSFDPFSRKESTFKITNIESLCLLVQGVVGIGVFDTFAIFRLGWLTGIVYTILVGIVCTHCLHLLYRSKCQLCRNLGISQLNYAQAIERAMEEGPPMLRGFSRVSHVVVDTCFVITQLGLCCIYAAAAIVLVPLSNELLKQCFSFNIDSYIVFIISFMALVLVCCMKNLKVVAIFSIFGVILLIASVCLFFWDIYGEFRPFDELQMAKFGIFDLIPHLGPLIFSLEAITVVSRAEGSFKSPKTFYNGWGILNLGMVIIIILQCSVGMFGWLQALKTYGKKSEESPNTFYKCIAVFYMMFLYISYGLQIFITVDMLWSKTQRKSTVAKRAIQFCILFLSVIFLMYKSTAPSTSVDYIVKVIFRISVICLGIIFPALLDICIKWPNNFRRAQLYLFKNSTLLLIGSLSILSTIFY